MTKINKHTPAVRIESVTVTPQEDTSLAARVLGTATSLLGTLAFFNTIFLPACKSANIFNLRSEYLPFFGNNFLIDAFNPFSVEDPQQRQRLLNCVNSKHASSFYSDILPNSMVNCLSPDKIEKSILTTPKEYSLCQKAFAKVETALTEQESSSIIYRITMKTSIASAAGLITDLFLDHVCGLNGSFKNNVIRTVVSGVVEAGCGCALGMPTVFSSLHSLMTKTSEAFFHTLL